MKVSYYIDGKEKVTPMLIATAIAENHPDLTELEEIANHLLIYCEYERLRAEGKNHELQH